MAIQNFVSGGFYGKVGEFVGQRWKNIRTLRAYVIPHNPRTPAQQANRKFFSSAVPLAQLANSAYPHCPAFDTANNTQWAYRMRQAKFALEEGKNDVATIPIFPDNFIAPFIINFATVSQILNTRQIEVEISGTVPQEERNYSALLYFDTGDRKGEILVCSGKSSNEEPNKILLECGDTTEIDTASIFCRVFSNDDKTSETCIDCARIALGKSMGNVFNIATDLEDFTVNDDGSITATYKTPNTWSGDVSGSVSANISLTSCTLNLKAGGTDTSTANVFSTVANFVNVDGSVGVEVTIKTVRPTSEISSYEAQGTIDIVYNNAQTDLTTPNSGTKTFDFNPSWENKAEPFMLSENFITMKSATICSTDPQDGEMGIIVLMTLQTNPTTEAEKEWQRNHNGEYLENILEVDRGDDVHFTITTSNPSSSNDIYNEEAIAENSERIAEDASCEFDVSLNCETIENDGFTENTRATACTLVANSPALNLTIRIRGESTSGTLPAESDFVLDLRKFLQNIEIE